MLELVATVCLLTAPSECKTVHLSYAEDITPMQCAMRALPELAKWSEANPRYFVQRWTCRRAGKVQDT